MTDDIMALLGAIQKSDNGDLLKTIVEAALRRENSRGAHYRTRL